MGVYLTLSENHVNSFPRLVKESSEWEVPFGNLGVWKIMF